MNEIMAGMRAVIAASTHTYAEAVWETEPNRKEWVDPATGYPCLIVRKIDFGGYLCGYVGVPVGHRLHGADYYDLDVEVHGGLTYGDGCFSDLCRSGVPVEKQNDWWFGFDCSHFGDYTPTGVLQEGTYRDMRYVKDQVDSLAKQLSLLGQQPILIG